MAERMIIVGGVAAGTSAAAKAKRLRPDLEIVLYQREAFVAYSACGLPYFIAGDVADHHKLIARTPAQFAEQGITIHTEHEVTDIQAAAGRIRVRNLRSGREFDDGYDHLVLATGASPVDLPIPGTETEGVFCLRSMADGLAIKSFLAEHRPPSAVVVGGGYIGLEMVEALLAAGLKVTLIDRSPHVLRTLDPTMAQHVQQQLEAAGVTLRLNTSMQEVHRRPDERVCCVSADGSKIDSEVVILATGVRPNTGLAVRAGVALGASGAIEIDGLGRTNVERIYAAGDCCTVFHRVLNRAAYLPLGTTANKQGRTLGAYLGGLERPFAGVVGTAVTKFNDLHIASTGITEEAAFAAGLTVDSTVIESTDHAGYYPNARPIYVKLINERGTRRLLGGQIIGYDGVAKRIDSLAVALAQTMTIDDLAWSDFSYAPPFSSVWDPILVAAQKLAGQ